VSITSLLKMKVYLHIMIVYLRFQMSYLRKKKKIWTQKPSIPESWRNRR